MRSDLAPVGETPAARASKHKDHKRRDIVGSRRRGGYRCVVLRLDVEETPGEGSTGEVDRRRSRQDPQPLLRLRNALCGTGICSVEQWKTRWMPSTALKNSERNKRLAQPGRPPGA